MQMNNKYYFLLFLVASLGGGMLPAQAGDIRDDIIQAIKIDDAKEVVAQLARGADANMSDEEGNTLLILAAREGSPDAAEVLLKAGAKPHLVNAYGDTALHAAAYGGQERIVNALLDRGAPVGANPLGWTPLMYAAYGGHGKVLRKLLGAGSRVNAATLNGLTALMVAAMNGHEEMVRELLVAGADPKAVTQDGRSARELALERQNTDIADVLDAAARR